LLVAVVAAQKIVMWGAVEARVVCFKPLLLLFPQELL
jgi:hypothetical protein